MRISYGRVWGSGYNPGTGKSVSICPGGTKRPKQPQKKKIIIIIILQFDGDICFTYGTGIATKKVISKGTVSWEKAWRLSCDVVLYSFTINSELVLHFSYSLTKCDHLKNGRCFKQHILVSSGWMPISMRVSLICHSCHL